MNLITRLDSLRDYLRDLREGVTPPSAAEQIDEHLATIDDVCEALQFDRTPPLSLADFPQPTLPVFSSDNGKVYVVGSVQGHESGGLTLTGWTVACKGFDGLQRLAADYLESIGDMTFVNQLRKEVEG